MLDKRKSSMIAIATYAALLVLVNGQAPQRRQADADPRSIATQEGQTINLLCRFTSPIVSCKFYIPGENLEIKLNPDWNRNDNFRYYGEGLGNGICGITILNVHKENHGNASCVLDPNDGGLDVWGNIEIIIAKQPQPPQINIPNTNVNQLEAGAEIQATCESIDGRPAASITWFLDDVALGSGAEEIVESTNAGTVYYTATSIITHRLRPEDHTKHLICRATHPAYQQGFEDTRIQLNVNFRPVPLSEFVIPPLQVGSSASIGPITIQANPRPTLKWTVDGVVINQGEQTERFVANEPTRVNPGTWNATLTIIQLTLQDTTRTYKLRANNAFGTTDYTIRIGGSQDATASGLGVVSIIAITIISLFVLVVVALIVVAKITKRWCFAGDSMHPNGPDSEAQIAPDDDKTHEHYEQHKEVAEEEEPETGAGDAVKATNGKAKGNTSV